MTAASSNESTLRHSTRSDSITNSTDDAEADKADDGDDADDEDDDVDDAEGGTREEFDSAAIVVWTAANEEPMSTVPLAMFNLTREKINKQFQKDQNSANK